MFIYCATHQNRSTKTSGKQETVDTRILSGKAIEILQTDLQLLRPGASSRTPLYAPSLTLTLSKKRQATIFQTIISSSFLAIPVHSLKLETRNSQHKGLKTFLFFQGPGFFIPLISLFKYIPSNGD